MNRRSGEETRRIILASAVRVFTDQGYASASMRTIAHEAGISVGGLYLYFRSKEDLYVTLMEEWMADLYQMTAEHVAVAASDPREALRRFITVSIEFFRSHREVILLQGRDLGAVLGRDLKMRFFRTRREQMEAIISEGISSGVFRRCNAAEAAKIVFCSLRGYILSMVVEEEALFAADDFIEFTLCALQAPATGAKGIPA